MGSWRNQAAKEMVLADDPKKAGGKPASDVGANHVITLTVNGREVVSTLWKWPPPSRKSQHASAPA
jgi:hypothetical protein